MCISKSNCQGHESCVLFGGKRAKRRRSKIHQSARQIQSTLRDRWTLRRFKQWVSQSGFVPRPPETSVFLACSLHIARPTRFHLSQNRQLHIPLPRRQNTVRGGFETLYRSSVPSPQCTLSPPSPLLTSELPPLPWLTPICPPPLRPLHTRAQIDIHSRRNRESKALRNLLQVELVDVEH